MVHQEYLHGIIVSIDNILAHLMAKEGLVENLKKCREGLNSSNCILNLKSMKFQSRADCLSNCQPSKVHLGTDVLNRGEEMNMIKITEELIEELERVKVGVQIPKGDKK